MAKNEFREESMVEAGTWPSGLGQAPVVRDLPSWERKAETRVAGKREVVS